MRAELICETPPAFWICHPPTVLQHGRLRTPRRAGRDSSAVPAWRGRRRARMPQQEPIGRRFMAACTPVPLSVRRPQRCSCGRVRRRPYDVGQLGCYGRFPPLGAITLRCQADPRTSWFARLLSCLFCGSPGDVAGHSAGMRGGPIRVGRRSACWIRKPPDPPTVAAEPQALHRDGLGALCPGPSRGFRS
jgi:hypothetical protein